MKRIGCLIAALSLLMTLSACHTGGEAEQTLRIGVALYQQEDTFIETVTRELQRVALEKEQAQNCKINLYITDGKESQTSQNEQVDRFLERGYDVICVNIVDRTAAAVILPIESDFLIPFDFVFCCSQNLINLLRMCQ